MARDLLGQWLISTTQGLDSGGRIIETEAYLGLDDPASHAFGGRCHAGNAAIYGSSGTWYVYRSYGLHWCLNLVCGPPQIGAAVLLRAIVPEIGLEVIRSRRSGVPAGRWTDGPGKLCQALGVDRQLDGLPMDRSAVVVAHGSPVADTLVTVSPRIGISKAVDWPLRYRAQF